MKVLVLGGSGNISREIVRALLERDHQVTAVTRGQRPLPPGVQHVAADRRDRPAFEAALRGTSPEVVIDMIAYHPDDTTAALQVFEGRVEQWIHCSTVMTYGPPLDSVWADEGTAQRPRSTYGQNKARIDALLLHRHREAGLPVTIVKPSYTFGPGIPLHRQVGDDGRWIDRLRKGKPMLSAGDGDKRLQFLPSRDAGDFFALLVGREAAVGNVYHMVHPRPTSWDEWHRLAMAAIGREVEIVHAPTDWLMAVAPARYGALDNNFGHEQLFSGAKAARDVPEWQPQTDRTDWVARNLAWMDEQGLVVDTDRDADDLEDRIIAGLRQLRGALEGRA